MTNVSFMYVLEPIGKGYAVGEILWAVSDLPPSLIEFSRLQKNVLCWKVAEASLKKSAAEAV
jgi:hypothetical protein